MAEKCPDLVLQYHQVCAGFHDPLMGLIGGATPSVSAQSYGEIGKCRLLKTDASGGDLHKEQ